MRRIGGRSKRDEEEKKEEWSNLKMKREEVKKRKLKRVGGEEVTETKKGRREKW